LTKTSTNGGKLENYVFPAQAARIVGVTKQAMSNLVRQGYFTTKTVAGRVLVLRSEVESFVARPKGRPTKEMQAKSKLLKNLTDVFDRGNTDKYISQAEAARIRGVSKQAIGDLIQRGRLTAVRVANRTLVIRSEIEAFVPRPRTGRPPKKKTGLKTTLQKKSRK
jgi:excisionase family DNA binding protein